MTLGGCRHAPGIQLGYRAFKRAFSFSRRKTPELFV